MKNKITALILNSLVGFLVANQAFAGLPPTNIQGQSDASPKTKFSLQVPYSQFTDLGGIKALIETGNTNILANPSFEAPGITTSSVPSWTLGTNVTAAANTSSYKDGKQAVTLSTNVTGVTGAQVLFYQSLTPGSYDANVNKIARLWVNTSITTLQVCAYLASGTVNCQAVPSSSTWQPATSNFIMPSSGTIGVALYTTAAIAASTTIAVVDKAEVKDADNLSQVSQAQLIGGVVITGCAANWTTSSASYATFATQTGCTYTPFGSAQAPSTNIPAVSFASLPPGEYLLNYEGPTHNGGTSAASFAYFQFYDGTNSARESSAIQAPANVEASGIGFNQSISYTTAQSNVTLQIRGKVTAGAAQIWGTTQNPGVIKVYYFPSQSQTALRPDQSPASWAGISNQSGSTAATGGFADPTFAGTTTTQSSRNMTCTASATKLGITCNLPRAGNYQVCYTGYANNSAGTTNTVAMLAADDGANTTIVGGQQLAVWTATATVPMGGCGNYLVPSAGSTTFKVRGYVSSGTGSFFPTSYSVVELDAPMSAPYLVGSVTSNTSGQERVERILFAGAGSGGTPTSVCSSGSCGYVYQSGNWSTGVTWNSTGVYIVGITPGEFSAPPVCTCSSGYSGVVASSGCIVAATSTSQLTVYTYSNGTTNANSVGQVICQGPR